MMKGDNIEEHKKFIEAYEGYSEVGERFGYGQDILNNVHEYRGGPGSTPPTTMPPSAPTTTPTNADANGGHSSSNPGPIAAVPPPAPSNPDRSTMTPPGPVAMAPLPAMPANLQAMEDNDRFDSITIQPIVYEGGGLAGYQKNVDTGEGIAKFYFDKTGERTSLADLKSARLQTN